MPVRLLRWWGGFRRAYWIFRMQLEGYEVWECARCGQVNAFRFIVLWRIASGRWRSGVGHSSGPPVCFGPEDGSHEVTEMRFVGR